MNKSRKTILVIGATSAIAQACCHRFGQQGYDLHLVGRDDCALTVMARDLHLRYGCHVQHESFVSFQQLSTTIPHLIGVFCAVGYLGDQTRAEHDIEEQQRIININFTQLVPLLTWSAEHLEEDGFLAVLSSVAGDRGRKRNYFYGAAKAGLNTFLAGLRHRYADKRISITVIKPGFIDTPMTYGILESGLMIKPKEAARQIWRRILDRSPVAYVPGIWRWIMWIIRLIPESIFKRMNI